MFLFIPTYGPLLNILLFLLNEAETDNSPLLDQSMKKQGNLYQTNQTKTKVIHKVTHTMHKTSLQERERMKSDNNIFIKDG